jgi:predicted NBD/HSP70 family sugar kinase
MGAKGGCGSMGRNRVTATSIKAAGEVAATVAALGGGNGRRVCVQGLASGTAPWAMRLPHPVREAVDDNRVVQAEVIARAVGRKDATANAIVNTSTFNLN